MLIKKVSLTFKKPLQGFSTNQANQLQFKLQKLFSSGNAKSYQDSGDFSLDVEAERILKENCFYRIIALRTNSTKEQIKKRYRDMTKSFHPDIWEDNRAHSVYQKVLKAYTVLENEEKRKLYDTFLRQKDNTNSKTERRSNDEFGRSWDNYEKSGTASKPGQNRKQAYDYWNRNPDSNFTNFGSNRYHQDFNKSRKEYSTGPEAEDRYWDQRAKHDSEYYRRARQAGRRASSQQADEARRTSMNIGWAILAIGACFFLYNDNDLSEEEIQRLKNQAVINKGTRDKMVGITKRESQAVIDNRIKILEKELKRKKVRIIVQKDNISGRAKELKRLSIPKYVKEINKRIKRYGFKMIKSEKEQNAREMSFREYYEKMEGEGYYDANGVIIDGDGLGGGSVGYNDVYTDYENGVYHPERGYI